MNKEDQPVKKPESEVSLSDGLVVWLAQGFGIGRLTGAPGTLGSVLGIGWFALLMFAANFYFAVAVAVYLLSILGSVFISARAEKILGQKDPSSVVIDEIVALPTCFLGTIGFIYFQVDSLPTPDYFFSLKTIWLTAGVFIFFRFFDIAKPWPVKQSQWVPKGWGVVIDDQLAAVYVNLLVLGIQLAIEWLAPGSSDGAGL